MTDLTEWTETEFYALCRDILAGMGMAKAEFFPTGGEEKAFRLTVQRESPDGIFRVAEDWLCIFARSNRALDPEGIDAARQAAVAADAGHLLLVLFDSAPPDAETRLFERLAEEDVRVVFLSGALAEALAIDYSVAREISAPAGRGRFSFARLRKESRAILEAAPWWEHHLTITVRGMGPTPLPGEDGSMVEFGLHPALRDGSFLLLGGPGAGKTAGLAALTRDLADSGGRAPVFLPLGRYQGDLFEILCEALSPGGEPVSREMAGALLGAGALTLMLDGVNEVRDPDLQAGLAAEINHLTDPAAPTSRSVWIASSRGRDYRRNPHRLIHLEPRGRRIQPLAPDAIYRFFVLVLGESDARAVFEGLDESARALFANPLLLTMAAAVHREEKALPSGRGALYDAFTRRMLQWWVRRGEGEKRREALAALFPEPLTEETFQVKAREALTRLARGASSTIFSWEEAVRKLADLPPSASPAPDMGLPLLEEFIARGILTRVGRSHVRFIHETLHDYFGARNLKGCAVEELIPEGGAPLARRDAVLFAALASPDPAPFFQRALEGDLPLAFDIFKDASWSAPPGLLIALVKRLWRAARKDPDGDKSRRRAILLRRLAGLAGRTVEDLLAEMDDDFRPGARGEELLDFYTGLGDAAGQRRVLERAMRGAEIPDKAFFNAAAALHEAGSFEKAVESYTAYLKRHPDVASAYNNRGLAYENMKLRDKALPDYRRAVQLEGAAYQHENLATLLHDMWQYEEAIAHVEQSLERDPTHARSHSILAEWLARDDPEAALMHREEAVRYTPRENRSPIHYRELADRQEDLGRHGSAIDSLLRMISLDPASPGVSSRMERIAELRRKHDAGARVKRARERLLKKGDLPFPTLVHHWLRAAGASVGNISPAWCLAEVAEGPPFRLPIMLIHEPFA
ncbi:MAG: tetratricopeptide repeat protein, partial [Desulfobacterales bacterium]|nr:tetratricopeptide repeat protein [Desulfobacterales bacterium]